MRFLFFMVIVFGVFLLALGQDRGQLDGNFVGDFARSSLATAKGFANSSTSTDDGSEELPAPEPAAVPATDVSEHAEVPVGEQAAPTPDELTIDDVLPKGEAYTRQQLEKHAPDNGYKLATVPSPPRANDAETMRDIHEANREALATLGRIDSVLHRKKGAKQ